MSRLISDTFQYAYDAEVKRAYGQKRLLLGTTKEKMVENAKSVYFRKKGKGLATLHVPGADRTAMNVDYSQVECVLQDWEAFDYIDKFDMKKINYSEIVECAGVASDALGLRMDQILIDKINAGYDSSNMKVGTTQTALTVATLRAAVKKLNDKGVPSDNRFFICSAQQIDDLLATTQVTSSDYNAVKTLVDGDVKKFMGLNIIMIASRSEGGLPNGTNTGDKVGFIYHKDAVGFALGQNLETEMTWVAEKGAYLCGGDFSCGAAVIDQDGIVGVLSGVAS